MCCEDNRVQVSWKRATKCGAWAAQGLRDMSCLLHTSRGVLGGR